MRPKLLRPKPRRLRCRRCDYRWLPTGYKRPHQCPNPACASETWNERFTPERQAAWDLRSKQVKEGRAKSAAKALAPPDPFDLLKEQDAEQSPATGIVAQTNAF